MARMRLAAAPAREAPRMRLASGVATGPYAPTVRAIDDMPTTEPLTVVTVPLALTGGLQADSYTARVVSGAALPDLTVTGSTLTVTAPASVDGSQTTIGVTATVGGTTSAEETFLLNALPQVLWRYTGAAWEPIYPTVVL